MIITGKPYRHVASESPFGKAFKIWKNQGCQIDYTKNNDNIDSDNNTKYDSNPFQAKV